MNLKFISKKTKQLSQKEISQICKLKNQQWKFNYKNQIDWFGSNIKLEDIHNFILIKSNIIGYTCLRKKKLLIHFKKKEKKIKYLHFDTLVVDRKHQKMDIGGNMMNFNNRIIKKNFKTSFLICEKKLIKFYEKFGWALISSKKLISNNNIKKKCMFFNKKFLFSKVEINIL
jgi:hypothetical protein